MVSDQELNKLAMSHSCVFQENDTLELEENHMVCILNQESSFGGNRSREEVNTFQKKPPSTFTVTQDITYILYPTGMLISCLFLLLTLFVYVVDPELHRPLFGKITIGFVLNNLAAFLCLAVVYLGKRSSWLVRGTSGCVLVGYFSLYTFTSFMMWINAMAANIFFKFSRVMTGAGAPDNSLKRFSLYAIYAQV